MDKLVSIVIPVYKTEKWLRACVQSALQQTYQNKEIILVDDGSPDNSPALCDELAAAHSLIRVVHKENGGLSSARNAGIEQAQGEYVVFLDSDDCLDLHALEEMVEIAEKENGDAVYPNKYYKVYEDKDEKTESLHFPAEIFTCDPKRFAVNVLIGKSRARRSTAVLYKLSVIKNSGGECLYPLGIISEDFFFNLRFLKRAEKICLYEKPSLYNLKRKGSLSTSYFKDFYETVLKMDDEVAAFLNDLDTQTYQTEGKREGLFFRNAYVFALNIVGDKATPRKERKKKCREIFDSERFQNAIHSKMEFPYFEGGLKRKFFKIALWCLRRRMYTLTFWLSSIAAKINAV